MLLAGHHLSEAVWLGIKRFSDSLEPAAYLAGTGLRLADDGTRIVVSDIDVSQLCRALAAVAADTCQRAVESCMAPSAVGRAVVRNLWSEVDNDNALSIHQLTRQVSPLGESLFSDDNRSALRQRPLDPSELGSFCLVDTPESTRCGLVRVLVPEAQISADGVITPLADPEPVDHLGASASLMPFLGSNAAARGVIGAKNLRQFVPVLGNEAPVVRTGWEGRLSDAGPIEFGVNLLTAFIPWKGFNIEDGVVVSESAARRMSSELVETLVEPLAAGEFVATPLSRLRGTCLEAGEVMLNIAGAHTPRSTIAPRPLTIDDACVVVRNGERTVRITARVSRPLVVGDKVTGRHGNKGVIGAILPDTQMPELLIAGEWHPAEMLMHPIGVLRRNCLGAVMELHSGLIALETGLDHVFVGALDRPARATPEALLAALAEVGHPDGRTKCRFDDAERTPVVAGLAYTVRLHHLAERKVQSRRAAALDPLAAQPSAGRPWRNGRRRGRPQRLGEMEMWALQSWNATAILADALTTRRNAHADELAPTLVRVLQLIAAAGFEVWLDDIELSTITASPATPKDLHIRPRRLQTYENLAVAELVPRANPKKTEDPWVDSWFARPLAASYQLGRLRLPDPGQRPIINPWLFSRALQLADKNGIDVQREGERGLDPIRLAQELIDANLLPDSWVLRAITVPPPELLVTEFGDRRRMTPLGQRYRQLGEALDEWNPRDGARARPPQHANPQRAVIDALFGLYGPQRRSGEDGSLSGLLNGKYGLLRHGLLGTRTVNSGRGVIAPDPTLGLRSVGLPTPIWEDLRLEEGTAVVVHRPPSLQRHSLIGLIAHANRHSAAITLHPAMIGPLAGDFDGDEVSVHVPRDAAAQREVSDVLGAVRRGPAHGEALLFQSQEIGLAGAPASDFDLGWEELEGRYLLALSAGAGMCSVSIPDLRDAQRDETLAAHLIDRMSPAGFEAKHLRTCVAPVGELFVRGRAHAVTGNLLDGLITTEYSVAAANAVEAMTTKKIAVRSAGNLTKRLVEALYDVTITASTCAVDGPSDLEHCRLISRRSCCADCYGVNPATGRAVDVGTAVGLLAAQSIGERGTQLALKAIHAGTKQVNLRSVEQALSKGGPGALEAMIAAYPDIADVHLRLAVAVLALGPGTESRLDEAIATQPPFARALERGRVDFIIDAMASAEDCTLTVTFDHPKERLAAGIGGI